MDELTITRAELAKFLNNDQDLIIRFEQLFKKTAETTPTEIGDLQQALISSESAKNVLIGKLDRLIELMGKSPPISKERGPDRVELIHHSKCEDESIEPPIIPNRGLTGEFHSSGSHQFIIENGLIVGIT